MKNILRFAAVAMVAIMLCLTLASCGGPNADPDDALAALKENGVTWAAKDNTVLPGVYKLLDFLFVGQLCKQTSASEFFKSSHNFYSPLNFYFHFICAWNKSHF